MSIMLAVTPKEFERFRDELMPLYRAALEYCEQDWDEPTALAAFFDGHHLLFLVFDNGKLEAFAQGQFIFYPKRTVFQILLAAGKFIKNVDKLDDFCAHMRALGVTHVEAWCRPSVERLLHRIGFTRVYTVVRKTTE